MRSISVTEYIDFRVYLRDYYEYQKKHHPIFSHRYFAQKAGIGSSSFLSRVMDGKRNLTRPMIEKFSKALKLTNKETVYFRNLVLFNQAKTADEKREHYTVLRSLKGIVNETVLQTQEYDYFNNWYTPVIRELATLYPFKNNFATLANMIIPPITVKEARASIQSLIQLGLIKKNTNGTYTQTHKSVIANTQIKSMAVRSYVDSMLRHSRDALNMDKTKRHISTMTLGVSAEQVKVIMEELDAFKDRIKQIVTENDQATSVYELNFALFPVSESIKDIKK